MPLGRIEALAPQKLEWVLPLKRGDSRLPDRKQERACLRHRLTSSSTQHLDIKRPPRSKPPSVGGFAFTPADGWLKGSSPGSAETHGALERPGSKPRLSPRLPLRRLRHAPHTPIGPPVMNCGP